MSSKGKGKGSGSGGASAPRQKKERPREKPVSKFDDLLMHGYKPWDPDADEFYDALVRKRLEIDAYNDGYEEGYKAGQSACKKETSGKKTGSRTGEYDKYATGFVSRSK